ncbi:uncharacterized protein DEA37_0013916 [Paragonimus westermani]|uniref:Protein FAM173B n=1 Tax=Paragonimus westermani TaxID=34504 RepID=A0A5J4N9H7_9TREM|nr:uncharacterized protein DEA37_0013916 [Paragonimus westermani]
MKPLVCLCEQSSNATDKYLNRKTSIFLGCGLLTSSVVYVLSAFIAPAFRRTCLPYLPATTVQLNSIARLLHTAQQAEQLTSLGSVIDLGSGDGRVLIDLFRRPELRFDQGVGVELNRPLVLYSRWKAYRMGVERSKLLFICGNMWKTDLSKYHTILVFGVDSMMKQLEEKINREILPNTFVITCRYPLPKAIPHRLVGTGPDSVYFYRF